MVKDESLNEVKYYIPAMGINVSNVSIQGDREENVIYVETKDLSTDTVKEDVLKNVDLDISTTIHVDSKYDVGKAKREIYKGILIITVPVQSERMVDISNSPKE